MQRNSAKQAAEITDPSGVDRTAVGLRQMSCAPSFIEPLCRVEVAPD